MTDSENERLEVGGREYLQTNQEVSAEHSPDILTKDIHIMIYTIR